MSSTVVVKFFASLREDIGLAETTVEARTLQDVLVALSGVIGADKLALLQQENVRVAVNQSLVSGLGSELHAGDEVAFLPPVTGG
jgi:molybdopterin synthase sulfur carrier subunit